MYPGKVIRADAQDTDDCKIQSCLLTKVITVAYSQVGVREQPLGSNRGPQVDEYIKSVGLSPSGKYAWCAAFVYYCFMEAAQELQIANPCPKTAGVHAMWRACGTSKLLRLTPKQATMEPERIKPGMLFFLDAGGGFGHVGLITEVKGVRLTTVEGNTTNLSGSREGLGVFKRQARTISQINLGFADVTKSQ